VVVALTVLALVLTPLAAMIFRITSQSHRIVGSAYRNAVLLDEVNYLESLPYDSLAASTTVTTVTTAPYPHTSKVIVAETWQQRYAKMKTVKLVITPSNPLYRSDSVTFARTVVTRPTLFNLGG
jgi:hypothetical protein